MSASITSGNTYELRSMADTGTCLAVGSSLHTDGASTCRYAVLDINDQKWVPIQTSSGWQLKNCESGKKAVIFWPNDGWYRDGQLVQQWGGGTLNAYWSIDIVGSTTIDGVECAVATITSTHVSEGKQYCLSYNSGNLGVIATPVQGSTTQRWAFFPTTMQGHLPAPFNLGASASVGDMRDGGNVEAAASSTSFTIYPRWKVPSAYAASASCEIRYRTRFMRSSTSRWESWGSWTAWAQAATTEVGSTSWLTGGINATVGANYKLGQIEYEVRLCNFTGGTWYGDTVTYHGIAASKAVTLYLRPTVTVSSASWSPAGISLQATSTYGKGPTTVRVLSVKAGGKELLKEPVDSTMLSTAGAISIPQEYLTEIPSSTVNHVFRYKVGTDQMLLFPQTYSVTKKPSYSGGSSVTPSIAESGGMTLKVGFGESWPEPRLWTLYNGEIKEYQIQDGYFYIMYPFNKPYELFASCQNGANFFAWHAVRTESGINCAMWNWSDGWAVIEGRASVPLAETGSTDAKGQAFQLSGRSFETYGMNGIRSQKRSVSGGVFDGVSASGPLDFEELAGKHATYRNPYGEIIQVAVTGVQHEKRGIATKLDVSMAREG